MNIAKILTTDMHGLWEMAAVRGPAGFRRVPVATQAQTEETTLKTAGQRKVNLVWEYTQAFIAGSVVITTLVVNGWVAIISTVVSPSQGAALSHLNVMAALVTGFYFGRTNHQRSGGIGGDEVLGGR